MCTLIIMFIKANFTVALLFDYYTTIDTYNILHTLFNRRIEYNSLIHFKSRPSVTVGS